MKALLIIDMQNDFMPTGSLIVPSADKLIPYINDLMPHFAVIVATQDFHPANHISFYTSHHNKKPFEVIKIEEESQTLWPVHCVAGEKGAEIVSGINLSRIHTIIRKGTSQDKEHYSCFFDSKRQSQTGLYGYFKDLKVTELHITGVAADICVYHSIKDALSLGFKVKLHLKGTQCINPEEFEKQKKEFLLNDDFEIIP